MKNRSYYSASIEEFLFHDESYILGILTTHHTFAVDELQSHAWIEQIRILKKQLCDFKSGHIFFEFLIPRMGKRVDNIFIYNGVIYSLEFKIGANTYERSSLEQSDDYALDLKNFHEGSHKVPVIPILIASNAPTHSSSFLISDDLVCGSLKSSASTLKDVIQAASLQINSQEVIDPLKWANTIYKPTPTIIEASQALYKGHNVSEISRSDSGAKNLMVTSNKVTEIIRYSKENNRKSICFITGVPGAGKTLAGLNIANVGNNAEKNEGAVFLSGNGPLVTVLQEALAISEKEKNRAITMNVARMRVKPFIQNIHHFRDDNLQQTNIAPTEKVTIFDEAQRAWNKNKTSSFMQMKKGVANFNMSEPEFLISVMDRHKDWCTIVCLIGGGQEIHDGEAGLLGWLEALQSRYKGWDIYCSDKIDGIEYSPHQSLSSILSSIGSIPSHELHLGVSLRSFRAEKLSSFVHAIIEGNSDKANNIKNDLKDYPLAITRDLDKAKLWVNTHARGSERSGLIASSGAMRLKPEGIFVKNEISPSNWFLKDKSDIRSSYALEDVATEFDIQGLEVDWTCLGWDADLRFVKDGWEHKQFKGAKWMNISKDEQKNYLENKYRVLLTRARQGMVIFIPTGSKDDNTRDPAFYDGTFEFLKSCGIVEI